MYLLVHCLLYIYTILFIAHTDMIVEYVVIIISLTPIS